MKFLITAGPTREPIDPVRFLSNRSSGKMGYALAAAALDAGHSVVLVSGPVALEVPSGVKLHRVETAQQMFDVVKSICESIDAPDISIHAAAVADYRPKSAAAQKIKKSEDSLVVELECTQDVLGAMRTVFGFRGFLAGFAAETENVVANAQEKLRRKDCDLVIANDVSRSDSGFDSDENEVILCFPSGPVEPLPKQSKRTLAREIIRRIVALAEDKLK
jgi:phosphopantothenoylcysteine synthetase/decarboxylase